MNSRSITIFFPLLCICSILGAQQNPQPYFRNYGTEDGLPSSEVYCVMQDSKGYMWFGTDNGAARFDGYTFNTYGAAEGLMSNVVFDIYEDQKGRIWFGTMTGEIYILEGDDITPYPYNDVIKSFEDKAEVFGLLQLTKDGIVYLNLGGFGLLKIDQYGNFETIRGKSPRVSLIIHLDGFTETIIIRSDWGNYPEWYAAFEKENVTVIDVIEDDRRFQKKSPKYLPNGATTEAQKLPSGEYLIQTGSYIHCLKDTQLVWSVPLESPINEIIPDENGALWLCLDGGNGLRRYSSLEDIRKNRYDQFLDGYSISKVFKDDKNGYWVTTLQQGIFYMPNLELVTYNMNQGLSDNYVTSIGFKNEHDIFIGCYNGDVFEMTGGIIKKIGSTPKSSHLPSLLFDQETQTLLTGGIYFMENNKKYFHILYPWQNKMFPMVHCWDNLHFNSKRQLIGGNGSAGFFILDIKRDLVLFSTMYNHLRGRVYALFSDHSDRLWVGRANGLFEFKDSAYVHVGITLPAFNNRVEDITELPDSTLVFGTKGFGVICWKGDDIKSISQADGLTSNMIEDVYVDENGILWVGTLNGLNKITFDSSGGPKIRQFTMKNGLPTNEITQINSYKGQVWLCTSAGLVKFAEHPLDTNVSQPTIQQVAMNSLAIKWFQNQTFEYNQNNLEFRFIALNYRQGNQIPYRYRLKQEGNWQYTENRSVNFSSLSPEDYVFEVQAQNEDDFWSDSTYYEFSVLPAWWMTLWFRFLVLLVLSGIAAFLFINRLRQIKKEGEIQQQLTDLERSALQAQMNPHFIFNSLNSIQNFILQNDKKKAVEFLSRFAKLVRHNLDVSRSGKVPLEQEVTMLENYLSLERERFNHSFDYDIFVDPTLKDDYVEFPPMLVQPFVENAILHGMAGRQAGGIVEIDFSPEDNNLLVKVTDNGSGYPHKQKEKTGFQHKSAGMSITQKRLEMLGARKENAIQVRELQNEKGDIKGTEVRILINLKKAKS